MGTCTEEVRDDIAAGLSGSTAVGPEVGVTQVRCVPDDASTCVDYVDELGVARVEDEISLTRVFEGWMGWV